MKLINSSVELIPQKDFTLQGVFKQIELAGRTCYKSENNIQDGSAKRFVEMLNTNKHYAMFEHGTIYLTCLFDNITHDKLDEIINRYEINPYSKVVRTGAGVYITTNYRVIVENDWFDDLQYMTEPTIHEKRITVRFICSRAIANEIVRHRAYSYAQESTRYCNYSKNKFDNSLTFIIPTFLNLKEGVYKSRAIDYESGSQTYEVNGISVCYDDPVIKNFLNVCLNIEHAYLLMTANNNVLPQFSRDILPLCLKTELVMTAFESDLYNFFTLRCAKDAHPDIQVLANKLKELCKTQI